MAFDCLTLTACDSASSLAKEAASPDGTGGAELGLGRTMGGKNSILLDMASCSRRRRLCVNDDTESCGSARAALFWLDPAIVASSM
jgi:hypothetical protein